MICWKIRIFAYWTTPNKAGPLFIEVLWFAEKFVSLLIEQHHLLILLLFRSVVICWKIRIFAYWTTPGRAASHGGEELWFAEKFVSLLIEQHLSWPIVFECRSCDLLKNSYLCLLNNTFWQRYVIGDELWFAEKFVSLLIEQHHVGKILYVELELWFAEKFVSLLIEQHRAHGRDVRLRRCDLLKNSYLCLLNNTLEGLPAVTLGVVICWKIRIFAYWTTPCQFYIVIAYVLWFAEKFVSLLIEQHQSRPYLRWGSCCDLLKNSYLCLLNNTGKPDAAEQW